MVSPTTFEKYSRLCNLLLKQGKVSPNLRELTINILGSDDQKELFFKEFDMVDQLSELYRCRGRTRELYSLFVENGMLDSALYAATSCALADDIPVSELEAILHYLHAETFFCSGGGIDMENHSFKTLRSTLNLSPSLKTAITLWDAARHVLTSFDQCESSASHADLTESCVKSFLLLFVSGAWFWIGWSSCWLTRRRPPPTCPILCRRRVQSYICP